jgi:hypothetical protein
MLMLEPPCLLLVSMLLIAQSFCGRSGISLITLKLGFVMAEFCQKRSCLAGSRRDQCLTGLAQLPPSPGQLCGALRDVAFSVTER